MRLLTVVHTRVFYRQWPAWLGGLMIGLLSVITFAWARPWGVVAGPREWVDWSLYSIGVYNSHPEFNPLLSTGSLLTLGLIAGAFTSALLSRQFALKVPPPFELLRSAVGGVLMGIGAALAAGCNVGGFFSATSALSGGGLAMMAGLIAGVFFEVQYYTWEIGHLRFKRGEGQPRRPRRDSINWKKRQPLLGIVVLIAILISVSVYLWHGVDPVSGYSFNKAGGLLLAALCFGVILHRSRFAFLQAFREPFMSGGGGQARGMAIAVVVSVIGFAALKGFGIRAEGDYIAPTFWAGSFLGGLIFGFGMPFAGGCGSGCCWRTAEGSIKVAVALAFLAVSNSLSQALINSSKAVRSLMGNTVFLPQYLSYKWSVALILMVMGVYYAVMTWNEKTRKLVG